MTCFTIHKAIWRISGVTLKTFLLLALVASRIRTCSCFLPHYAAPFRRQTLLFNSNHLSDIQQLQNDFCALRHGQSLANVAKIISSNPEIATIQHGLSDVGRQQALNAGINLVGYFQQHDYEGIVILSSDYKRAKETADIVADCCRQNGLPLYRDDVIIETRLRERWFGDWDGGSDEHYHDVWKDDALDSSHTIKNVESVDAVMDRTTTCVLEWDKDLTNHLIVLVAHGDVLQITQTAFEKMDGRLHRTCQHLETATLRPLGLAE